MSVSGAVLERTTSRLAGPAACTGAANGSVVYESPCGSARLMSVSVGESLKKPRIAVLYGSVAVGSEPMAGYDCVAGAAGSVRSVPSLIEVAVPLGVASRLRVTQVVPGSGQSSPDVGDVAPVEHVLPIAVGEEQLHRRLAVDAVVDVDAGTGSYQATRWRSAPPEPAGTPSCAPTTRRWAPSSRSSWKAWNAPRDSTSKNPSTMRIGRSLTSPRNPRSRQ